MKNLTFAVLLAACVAVFLVAQEVSDTSALSVENMSNISLLNVREYSSQFLNGNGSAMSSKYLRAAPSEDRAVLRSIGGDLELIDIPLEIALLSMCAGVVDIRPARAVEMLPANDPKLADLKLGAATYMDMQMARFSGKDSAPYVAVLKFVTDRKNVSEADIKRFMAQGIAAEVDAQFNKVSFLLNTQYNATLTRNTSNQYILSYEGYFSGTKSTKTLPPANSLETLSREMLNGANKNDFNQACVDQIRAQAALIPAVSQAGKTGAAEPKALLIYGLTAFYTASTAAERTNALKIVEGVYITRLYPMEYNGPQEKAKAAAAETAIYATLDALNPELLSRVGSEINTLRAALQSSNRELENIVNQAERSLAAYR
jgi:hypothetical protein